MPVSANGYTYGYKKGKGMVNLRVVAALLTLLVCGPVLAEYNYEYYEGNWSLLPDFDALTPGQTGSVQDFDISVRLRDSQYGFRFTGTITTAVADTYTF